MDRHSSRHFRAVLAAIVALGSVTTSAESQRPWRMAEIARIGGDDEGLASFNNIRDLQIGIDNRIWVLDFQVQALRLFGADGAPVKEVARKGAEPGELSGANGFRVGPDGRMVARDHFNGRLSFYSAAGEPDGQVIMPSSGYGFRWDAAIDGQGRLLHVSAVPRGNEYARVVLRHSTDYARADTAELPSTCSDLPPPSEGVRARNGFAALPFEPRILWVLATDGSVWCANTDEYRIRRFPFGAKAHDREVHVDVPRIPISAAERDSAIAGVESFLARAGGVVGSFDKGKIRRDRGQLLWFEGDDQGRLWVMRETPAGQVEIDVWDAAGRRVGILSIGPRRTVNTLFRVRGDRLAMVRLDDDELPTIVVYRVAPQ